jgi:hypothetical protein
MFSWLLSKSMCKQEVIRWDKIVQKNGVSNKEDPEMKRE